MPPRSARLIAVSLAVVSSSLSSRRLAAQETPKVVTPAFDFSGVIYGNYQFATDSARKAANGGNHPNKFDIERVYLNFRMPVGENAGIRVTTDVFNNTNTATNGYYPGWTVRLKYALIEYTLAKNAMGPGSNVKLRVGMMPNSFIDYEEGFWPRWVGLTITDRLGYFPSSDIGVGGIVTLPNSDVFAFPATQGHYGTHSAPGVFQMATVTP